MLEATGPKLTKVHKCTTCGSQEISDANRKARSYRCAPCKRAVNEQNDTIISMAEKIVGSQQKYRALPKDKKAQIRDYAQFLYEIGHKSTHQKTAEDVLKAGFVYVITNPTWPDHVKIGRAFDPVDRLSKYQTGCPYREYALFHSVYFENCYAAEKHIHSALGCLRETGEWFRLSAWQAMEAINQYKERNPCGVSS